jgi:hypothetical protein
MIRTTRCALLVLALVFAASASAKRPLRSLQDAKVGTSRSELLAQITYSTNAIKFFTVGKGRWMTERRHDTCLTVPGARRGPLCFRARRVLLAQLWLRDVAKSRYKNLYSPSLPWAFWNCVATGWTGGAVGVGARVSSGEGGATTNTGNGYFGRYQADEGFMSSHGADMLVKYRGLPASSWSVVDQTIVAERGFQSQGPGAWPNTAPPCLYLRAAAV